MKKKDFLELLDNEEIKDKIKEIVGLEIVDSKEKIKIEELKENNIKLEELVNLLENKQNDKEKEILEKVKIIDNLKKIIYGKDESIDDLDTQIVSSQKELKLVNNKIDELEKENKTIYEELLIYKKTFKQDLKIYRIYEELSPTTKDSIKNIFKNDSLDGFISCGVQEKNISSFWEYIKLEIINDKNKDIEKLTEIFYYFFDKYRLAYPMYELDTTKVDDNFDTQLHIKHNRSQNVSGSIKKVLLHGYLNIKTNNIVKQSIVFI